MFSHNCSSRLFPHARINYSYNPELAQAVYHDGCSTPPSTVELFGKEIAGTSNAIVRVQKIRQRVL